MGKWFNGVSNIEELKKEYKKLAKTWHPDMNKEQDTTKIFIEIKNEFDRLFKMFQNSTSGSSSYQKSTYNSKQSSSTSEKKSNYKETAEGFRAFIDKLLKVSTAINIEITGSWIWVSGDTYSVRLILRELGMEWSKSNKKWYWHEGDMSKKIKKAKTWEYKVEKYGYDKVQ